MGRQVMKRKKLKRKAAYLKRRREQQKQALVKLDAAWAAIAEARLAVSRLEEC